MDLSERELEDICVLLMQHDNPFGDFGEIAYKIAQEFQDTGRVCLDVVRDE